MLIAEGKGPSKLPSVAESSARHSSAGPGMGVKGMASRFFPTAPSRAGNDSRLSTTSEMRVNGDAPMRNASGTASLMSGGRRNYRNSIDVQPKGVDRASNATPSNFSRTVNNFFGKDQAITATAEMGIKTANQTRNGARMKHSSIEPDCNASIMSGDTKSIIGCSSVMERS
jgi:hypothetical protein